MTKLDDSLDKLFNLLDPFFDRGEEYLSEGLDKFIEKVKNRRKNKEEKEEKK